MINENCPCKKKKCERHGNYDDCKKHHAQSKRERPCERSKITQRKILSFVLITAFVISVFGTQITVSAEEQSTPSGIPYSEISNELDSYVKTYEEGLASCEVAVFDGNGVITSNYYGFSDIENQVETDASTVYEWGSCSKLLVWTAVMQQCERGNIDLDTDIRAYLPEGFLTKLQYEDEKITMKNLMSHNAGF